MKNKKYIFFILTFFLSLANCIATLPIEEEDANCYWMENYSGKFEWVATENYFGKKYNKKECFEFDSCDGGLGKSGGGCYKWAETANDPRLEWHNVVNGVKVPMTSDWHGAR